MYTTMPDYLMGKVRHILAEVHIGLYSHTPDCVCFCDLILRGGRIGPVVMPLASQVKGPEVRVAAKPNPI